MFLLCGGLFFQPSTMALQDVWPTPTFSAGIVTFTGFTAYYWSPIAEPVLMQSTPQRFSVRAKNRLYLLNVTKPPRAPTGDGGQISRTRAHRQRNDFCRRQSQSRGLI